MKETKKKKIKMSTNKKQLSIRGLLKQRPDKTNTKMYIKIKLTISQISDEISFVSRDKAADTHFDADV